MPGNRIKQHPILEIPTRKQISFTWKGIPMEGFEGETIASALIANGVSVFGNHPKDGSPQGIFCANGQCSQCMVFANGMPLKACVELLKPGMVIAPANALPELPNVLVVPPAADIPIIDIPVLIIGGGPAGLSAAIELGKRGVNVILVDDKHRLGGKLILQTHRFFGSTDAVFAGTRGIHIATRLEKELQKYDSVQIWLNSTCLAVFSDHKIGVLKDGSQYVLINPQVVLISTGAREKFLAFPGNTLPGVFGAGAFQTLVNRDLVEPSRRLFIIGGGNVGLITGYHALQAGIEVVGLAEALPECGGYKVHKDKLVRLGVPVFTSHTILSANGKERVESVTIARVDAGFQAIPGTEKTFACDSILVAVGLEPVNELLTKAIDFGYKVFAAGDAEEIAEASAAMFSGKIRGLEIARYLGVELGEVPEVWYHTGEILKSRPGMVKSTEEPRIPAGLYPVFHCTQEIPCDPCASICPKGLIFIDHQDIRAIPAYTGGETNCVGCEKCITVCPGLAITLVDYRKDPDFPIVSIPYEFNYDVTTESEKVTVLDTEGTVLGDLEVVKVERVFGRDHTIIVKVRAPASIAPRIAGIRSKELNQTQPMNQYVQVIPDEAIICRCERVSAGEIRQLIRAGYRDINEIKAITRAAMGACGSKTCNSLIHRLFRDEGITTSEITEQTRRPIFIEVPLKVFAGITDKREEGS
ncbi:MAG TPA: FAD-dependent oxidoreductase [Anaerolineaceae bacterium]